MLIATATEYESGDSAIKEWPIVFKFPVSNNFGSCPRAYSTKKNYKVLPIFSDENKNYHSYSIISMFDLLKLLPF